MPSLYLIESKVREAGSRAPRTRGARRPIAGACVWGGRDAWRVGRDGDASSSWAGNAWVGFSEPNGCSMDKPRSIRKHMVATDYATPRRSEPAGARGSSFQPRWRAHGRICFGSFST
jgi:hypothetical protein